MPHSNTDSTPSKLPLREKLGVGTGGLTVSLGNQSVRTTGQAVLNMILGINAFWVGVVLAIPLLWDAITDPIMGNISDNFKSKYGRRRPFIFAGAILMGLSFASIWMIPMHWSDGGKLAWFLTTSLLFYTSYTIFSVPFIALTYEMTPDYDERTAVQGFVTFWNRLGEMTYMGLIPLSLTFIAWKYGYADSSDLTNAEKMEGIRSSAAIYGGIGMTLFGMLPALFAKEPHINPAPQKKEKTKLSFWKSARLTLQNRAFAILCCLAVFTIIAGVFAANMDWYLLIFYLSGGDVALGTQWKLIVTVGYAIVGILGIPLIVWVTGKLSKIQGFMLIYGMMVLNAVMRWFVYQPGRFEEPLNWSNFESIIASLGLIAQSLIWLDPLTGGMFWIGVGVLGQSMIADVCDDDEVKNGQRREGMFGAIYGWSMKASFALSFVLIGLFLEGIGFDPQWGSTRWLQVDARAEGYASTTADFSVTDDESELDKESDLSTSKATKQPANQPLNLSTDRNYFSESDGEFAITLSRPQAQETVTVLLKSDRTDLLRAPESVTFNEGDYSKTVTIEIIDDTKPTGTSSATLTAWIKNENPVRAQIHLIDNDSPTLVIKIDGHAMSEQGGTLDAHVQRNSINKKETTVALSILSSVKGKENDATLPEHVTLAEGQDSAVFTITAIDNDIVDGQQSERTFLRMRLAMCIGASIPALLCFLLLYFYPLTKTKAEENRLRLETMRQQR